MTLSKKQLKEYEAKIRGLIDDLRNLESDSEDYQNVCEEICALVGESDYQLQWVVDAYEDIIH